MSADIYTNKITHTVTAKTHSKLARFVTYAYDKIDHFQFILWLSKLSYWLYILKYTAFS